MASSSVRIASAKQSQTASEVPLYNCTAVKSLSFQPAQTAQAIKTIRNTCVSNVSKVGSPSLEEVTDFVNRVDLEGVETYIFIIRFVLGRSIAGRSKPMGIDSKIARLSNLAADEFDGKINKLFGSKGDWRTHVTPPS